MNDLNKFYFKQIKTKQELREAAIEYINILYPYIDDYGSFGLFEVRQEYYKSHPKNDEEKRRMSEAGKEILDILLADKLIEPYGSNGSYYKLTDDGRKAKKIGRIKFLKSRTPWKDRGRNWILIEVTKSLIGATIALLIGLATFQLKHQQETPPSKPKVQQKSNVRQDAVLDSSLKK